MRAGKSYQQDVHVTHISRNPHATAPVPVRRSTGSPPPYVYQRQILSQEIALRTGFEIRHYICTLIIGFFNPIQLTDILWGTIPIKMIILLG